jgi:hypothetical protein
LRRQLLSGKVAPGVLTGIAQLLESHVRFEEKEFPLIEQGLSENELIDLATTGRYVEPGDLIAEVDRRVG